MLEKEENKSISNFSTDLQKPLLLFHNVFASVTHWEPWLITQLTFLVLAAVLDGPRCSMNKIIVVSLSVSIFICHFSSWMLEFMPTLLKLVCPPFCLWFLSCSIPKNRGYNREKICSIQGHVNERIDFQICNLHFNSGQTLKFVEYLILLVTPSSFSGFRPLYLKNSG